jgi:hypothetical protein
LDPSNGIRCVRQIDQPLMAAAPPTISDSSFVIAAWRVLL